MSEPEIKMAVKSSTNSGLAPTVIHTGQMKQEPILNISKIGDKGLGEHIIEKSNKLKMIQVDSIMMSKLLDECAKDLMHDRILSVPSNMNSNGQDQVKIIIDYDPRNRIFTFGKDINYINKVFNLKLGDLSDFLSNFFYTNINIYSQKLFEGVPEILPVTSVEALQNNRVIVTIH